MTRTSVLWLAAPVLLLSACDGAADPVLPVVAVVSVSAPESNVRVDSTLQLTAKVLGQTGLSLPSQTVTWHSSDDAIATVDARGLVTGRDGGDVLITAVSGRVSGSRGITVVPRACSGTATAGSIAPGATRTGTLGPDSCLLPHGGYGVGYTIDIDETRSIRVSMRGINADPLIFLANTRLGLHAVAEPPIGERTAVLLRTVPPGSYVLWATTFPGMRGTYEMSVEVVPTGSCSDPMGTIAPGQSVDHTLAYTACLLPNGSLADLWQLDIDERSTVRIDMSSSAFDAFLLLSTTTEFIAADNNSGGGANARIELTLDPGTYIVWASSFLHDRTGAYRLTVSGLP